MARSFFKPSQIVYFHGDARGLKICGLETRGVTHNYSNIMHSHVPKFGNWDNDNVPYTAYFENARRERIGVMINPNDPMENPEAFNNMCMRGGHNVDAGEVKASHTHSHNEGSLERRSHHEVLGNHTRRHVHHRNRGSQSSFTAESGSERSHSDQKRSKSKAGSITGSSSSSSQHRYRSGSHSSNDPHMNHQGSTIPKFGTWDVTDPKSGEGYTAIFSRVQNEKHTASSHSPSTSTPPLNNCSNIKNQCEGQSFRLSKYCCCLFASESK